MLFSVLSSNPPIVPFLSMSLVCTLVFTKMTENSYNRILTQAAYKRLILCSGTLKRQPRVSTLSGIRLEYPTPSESCHEQRLREPA